jgi:hypothetical protein
MKRRFKFSAFNTTLIIVLSLAFAYHFEMYKKEQRQAIDELKTAIEQRNYLDSLYWEHLENCSFIHKESIGVGYQGYLYDKESRK